MSKTKQGKNLDSYTVHGTTNIVRVGDCVMIRPSESDKAPYIARLKELKADHRNNVRVKVRWYYRPEDSEGGRRIFHGVKELFLSDHYDWLSAHTIDEICTIHTFRKYIKLKNVGAEDYFCRFEYETSTRVLTPERVTMIG